MPQVTRILSFDPGKHNFGMAVLDFSRQRPRILYLGMLSTAIKSVLYQQFAIACETFRRAIRRLIQKYRPQRIIIERFLPRFRGFGNTAELIGIMLGIIWSVARQFAIQVIPTTSASWKNQYHRDTQVKVETLYKLYRPIVPHCLDACLLGIYGHSKITPYRELDLPRLLQRARKHWIKLPNGGEYNYLP